MLRASYDWLVTRWQWPYAAGFAALFLLAALPLVLAVPTPQAVALALIFVQLPVYMLHQLEEHAGDRFRTFVNETMGGGVEVLSRRATFVINSLGVWGVDLLALYLAVCLGPGWGLMAVWLPLVNAVGHIGQGLALRRYNPGLWSSVFVFLPVGIFALVFVTRESGAGWAQQAVGLGVALLVHALIIVHVKRMLARARR